MLWMPSVVDLRRCWGDWALDLRCLLNDTIRPVVSSWGPGATGAVVRLLCVARGGEGSNWIDRQGGVAWRTVDTYLPSRLDGWMLQDR